MIREPDLVSDAAIACGCKFPESVMFRAALEVGFGKRAEEKARELYQIYQRAGYSALPNYVKDMCLRVTGGLNAGFTRKSA